MIERRPPVIAIDPGPTECGYVEWDTHITPGVQATTCMLDAVRNHYSDTHYHLVIEQIQHYGSGMAVGTSVFDTVFWYGRMVEAFKNWDRVHFLARPQIKAHLCGSTRAKDTNVRQALIDRFGGSLKAAKGTKKDPGPLYGIKSHAWQALAVAVTFRETWKYPAP